MKTFRLVSALLCLAAPAHAQVIVNGGGSGSGTVTSIATACGLSGGPITTTGTIQGGAPVREATGTSDTILSSDCGKVVTSNNTNPVAVTLPQATGAFGAPFFYTHVNVGVGLVTITTTTSVFNGGGSTLQLAQNQSVDIASDGSNYIAAMGKGSAPTTDASQLTSGTLAAARLPAFTGDCTTSAGTATTLCGIPRHPGYVSANWYQFANALPLGPGVATPANRIHCHFAVIGGKTAVTITDLGVGIGTAGSSNIQLAIYSNANGRPANLIGNTGSIANTSGATAITGALAANKNLGPGGSDGGAELWACSNQNDSTATYATNPASSPGPGIFIGSPTASNILIGGANGSMNGIYCSGAGCQGGSSTFGTWPAALGTSTWTLALPGTTGNVVPQVIFKVQ